MSFGEPLDEIAYRANEMAVDALLEYAVDPPPDEMVTHRSFLHPDGWQLLGMFDASGPLRFEWVSPVVRHCSRWDQRTEDA